MAADSVKRSSSPNKEKRRILTMPLRPRNAPYILKYDENELRLETNPWNFRKIRVAACIFVMAILLGKGGYEGLLRLGQNPGTTDYFCVFIGIPIGLCLCGIAFYILFNRATVILNNSGMEYRDGLLLYRQYRHFLLNDIRGFECRVEKIDSRHTEYFTKAIIRDQDAAMEIPCVSGDDAGWLTMELNYMHTYLLIRSQGEVLPPFRKNGILNNVKYEFE